MSKKTNRKTGEENTPQVLVGNSTLLFYFVSTTSYSKAICSMGKMVFTKSNVVRISNFPVLVDAKISWLAPLRSRDANLACRGVLHEFLI